MLFKVLITYLKYTLNVLNFYKGKLQKWFISEHVNSGFVFNIFLSTIIESIIIGDTLIKPLESAWNLGSWFDAHMRMNVHIGKICSKAFRGLYNIRQIRKFLTVQSTKTLVHAFVSSHLDYCNALLFSLPKYQLDHLQKVQNAAARVIFQIPKFDHITTALIDLHWLPVMFRVLFKLLLFGYKSFCFAWNQLLIMLFAYLLNLFCSFQKPTALHLGTGSLLMLHLFHGTCCH